ncbi:MAG: polysaccharide biosynthesis tyrosine autokinase [Cyanobacteria bacterium J06607_13]
MRTLSPRTTLSPFKRYWWVAIPAFLATMGGALAYLAIAPRIYEATVRLSVEDERTSVSNIGQTLTETDELGGANPIVTQAEVVRSQGVLRAALDRYRELSGQPAESGNGQAQTGQENDVPTVDHLERELIVDIIPATNIVEVTYRSTDPVMSADLVNAVAQSAVNQNVEDINVEAAAVRAFLESQLPALQSKLRQAEQAESQYRQSNSLVSVDAQNQQMVMGLAELEQEERSLIAALQEVLTRDQRLQDVTGITSPETAYDLARVGQDAQLQTLRSELTQAQVQLSEARSRLGDQHPELLALVDQVNSLQAIYQQRLNQISPAGLGNVAAAMSTNELSQDLIAQSINSSIQAEALADRLAVVQSDLATVRGQLAQMPAVQQPLSVLSREREDAADSLELIRTKLEEARIAEAQLVSNVRIVGMAEPDLEPVSPKPLVVLALGAIAGSILSVGAILLLDLLDASLQSGDEVEKLVKLPVLGYLPRLSAEAVDVAGLDAFLDNPRHVEPYRALLKTMESRQRMREAALRNGNAATSGRSAMEGAFFAEGRAAGSQSSQVVVVSSPTSNEGTSSVATCLGAVSAMLGRKTLIIEANPLNPIQHLYLQVESQPGLTDVINHSRPLTDAVKLTTIGRLSVLPYGQTLNRPSTVTESSAMRVLLDNLTQEYDLILIDTAPVDSSADAATVSQMTDGLLLVTRPGYTPRSVLADTVQQLRKSGAPLLGIAMNETILPEEQLGQLPMVQQPAVSQSGMRRS